MVGGLFRLASLTLAVLGLAAGTLELALRAAGAQPRAPAELSNVVPDSWTDFRLRPGVSGQEAFVTNDQGMHAPRSYTLAKPPGALRVAVLGSSVVYGLALRFADTIPGVVERELQATGQRAEVLNFGTHAFTILNLSAQLQAYVHQFEPDVVVVVVDLQVGLPQWPDVRPAASPGGGIQRLGGWEALLTRGSSKSALLAILDDPRPARRWIRRATGLPLGSPPRPAPDREPETPTPPPVPSAPSGPAAGSPQEIRAYEQQRERDLAAPMAAMAAFAAEKSVALYFVTPYGPYFDLTEDELARMSVHHFLEDAARVHGSERAAIGAEVELITRVARRVAAHGSAHVIDMLEASRGSSLRSSPDFTVDGVHLSPKGNAAVGKLIASRIARDIERRSGDQD
jgi:lysophospholipase L1-like esterase